MTNKTYKAALKEAMQEAMDKNPYSLIIGPINNFFYFNVIFNFIIIK
jgi:hypothetical protein